MQVRLVNVENDYDEIAKWWKSQGWPVIPPQMMAPSGFIAEDDKGQKIAATWMFPTNCPIFIMEWTVGNPDVQHEVRSEGLKMVTDAACDWAKENGAIQVFTMTKHERFIKKLEEYGFQKTDSGMTHLMRSL